MLANVHILYEDNHLLAVVKPVNMPVQRDRSGDEDLLSLLKRYIAEKYHKPGEAYLGLVHRLDRPVGGTMVFARTSKAASRLSEAFRTHAVQKTYLCVARGAIAAPMELTDYLLKDERTGMVRVSPEGKLARLVSEPIAQKGGFTLLRVRLLTGRPHQIRVQHAHAGHPLWGDARYGNGKPGEQIALWSHKLICEHPTRREPLSFISLPPLAGAWRMFESELERLAPDSNDGSERI